MNLVQSIDWHVMAPPVTVAATAVVVLVADLFLTERRKALLGWISVAGLALAALSLIPLRAGDRATFCFADRPDLCSYTADTFAVTVQLLVLGGALVAALLSVPGLRPGPASPGSLPRGEFWFLLLVSASGAALLPAARDLATLVLALEITTLPAYALVALRRDDRLGPEAAVKFFLSSVTATAVMLLGISFVYAATGSLFLDGIADALPAADPDLATLAEAGVVLTLVGFVFKTAAAPFHFWVPETYLGAPLPVAGYLSVVGKTAGLAGLILVTARAFPAYGHLWGPAVAVLAGVTMTLGNVAALRTGADDPRGAVRLLAWSSIGQAGFLLAPVAAAGYAEDADGLSTAMGAAVAYALMYAVVNLGAFAVVVAVAGRRATNRIADYRGLVSRRPLLALALGFFLLCLAGLPPGVVGLFAKVAAFRAVVDAGLGALAVVMAVNVVIALVYYLRWTAQLFRSPETAGEVPAGGTATVDAASVDAASVDAASAGVASAGVASAGAGAATGGPDPAGGTPARPGRHAAPVPEADEPQRVKGERAPDALPLSLAVATGLTAALALALSGAPQLILRFATGTLF